jgi:hypothetical protein
LEFLDVAFVLRADKGGDYAVKYFGCVHEVFFAVSPLSCSAPTGQTDGDSRAARANSNCIGFSTDAPTQLDWTAMLYGAA